MKGRGLNWRMEDSHAELRAGRGAVVTNSGPRWVWGRRRGGCILEQGSPKRETTGEVPVAQVVATCLHCVKSRDPGKKQ